MKLFKLSQSELDGYDVYRAAVVAADNPALAQLTHPDGHSTVAPKTIEGMSWPGIADVHVELIGEAAPGLAPGVIVADYKR